MKANKAVVIDHSELGVTLGEDVYSAFCPIGHQTSDNQLPCAVKLPIGWVRGDRFPIATLKANVCFASLGASVDETRGLDLATQVSTRALESNESFVSVDPRSKSAEERSKF